jgi:hypothetical protein
MGMRKMWETKMNITYIAELGMKIMFESEVANENITQTVGDYKK